MDGEDCLDDEDVKTVLAQVSSELFHILCRQPLDIIRSLHQNMLSEAAWHDWHASSGHTAEQPAHYAEALLDYYKSADAAKCRHFLQNVCMLCEAMPMHLEARLMSVALGGCDGAVTCGADQRSTSPPEEQVVKRPRIDHWEQYVTEVRSLLLSRWERLSGYVLKTVELDKVWVNLRSANRGRDRPDQTPALSERGSNTPEPYVDCSFLDTRVTLETFLQGCRGKVTFLVGQAGSGKTLLMSCLGNQWANGLGPFPSSYLFVLLECRQLNLLSRPLSLSELLFHHYLPPSGGQDTKKAVLSSLLSNPGQSCWVLDGYDEFLWKVNKQEVQSEALDLEQRLPVPDLITGLLNRQLLPGSSVLVTCRARDVVDFDGLSEKIGELQAWDLKEIEDYVHSFFNVGDGDFEEEALQLLRSNRHLLTMSSLPARCNICCICLKHLLLRDKDPKQEKTKDGMRSEAKAPNAEESDRNMSGKEGANKASQDVGVSCKNSRETISSNRAQLPSTRTQIYLTAIAAYLSLCDGKETAGAAGRFPQGTMAALPTLTENASHVCELSQLAWRGLEESKILFLEEDVPETVSRLAVQTGLLNRVELRCHDGTLVTAYGFVHLTVQEFLAALRIMTSDDVSHAQLKKRFSLKTRWTSKADQKTAFTDSLYLFVCGLASPTCTGALVQVAKASVVKGARDWVQKRQALVLKLLGALCQSSRTLTGPKMLQLCRCIQESQSHRHARQVVSVRPTLELRNFWLSASDIDALAFVVSSPGGDGVGLDFGACSMDPDALSSCCCIHYLSFRGRMYGDKFVERFSRVLPEFTLLKKLEFSGASLTSAGATSLASGLQMCRDVTEINLSGNNLQDEGVEQITELFSKLRNLVTVKLGRNNTSLKALVHILQKMTSVPTIQAVHANGTREITVTFAHNSEINGHKTPREPTVSLLEQNWSQLEMENVAKLLVSCPTLSVLDLSGGFWDKEILKTLAWFVPKLKISERMLLNGSCSSVKGLVVLTALLDDCPSVKELSIRLQSPAQVSIVFKAGRDRDSKETSKTLCLTGCGLQPSDLGEVWRSFRNHPDHTEIKLSNNRLGDKGLKKLLDFLPRLRRIREINVSNNDVSMESAVMLAKTLSIIRNLEQVEISCNGKEEVVLKFNEGDSDNKDQMKKLRITKSTIHPPDIAKVCRVLVNCHYHLELEFSGCSFVGAALGSLVQMMPRMSSLRRLGLDESISSTHEALVVVGCLNECGQVGSVELSPQNGSCVGFSLDRTEQVSCRLSGFLFCVEDVQRLLGILQLDVQLSYLDLSGNQLGDNGVKQLVDFLPKLQINSYININNNSLSHEGFLHVARTLHGSSKVSAVEISLEEDETCLIWFTQDGDLEKSLSVKNCSLNQDHLLALAEIMSNCPNLGKLEFGNNQLEPEMIQSFLSLLKPWQTGCSIRFEESWINGEEAVSFINRFLELHADIQSISVHRSTIHLSLKPGCTLDSISLIDCGATGLQITRLRSAILHCPALTKLHFSLNRLDPAGSEFSCSLLPSLPNLLSLSVVVKEETVSVIEELVLIISRSSSIQHLNLSGHVISDTMAQSLTSILPRLQSFNLDRVQLSEDSWKALARALRDNKCLRSLTFNRIQKPAGQPETNSRLEVLVSLEGNTVLENIGLEGWHLGESGIRLLTGLMPQWKELREIRLSKNHIGDESGQKLLHALKTCARLQELHLSCNSLGDRTAAEMSLTFASLTRLAVLDLSENSFGPEAVSALSEAVRSLWNLTKIHLTSVGTPALGALTAALTHCPLLQDVGLGWNDCADDVIPGLTRVLASCPRLAQIDLECNRISVSGVELLVKACRPHPSLRVISLWKNDVPAKEQQKFALRERRLKFSST